MVDGDDVEHGLELAALDGVRTRLEPRTLRTVAGGALIHDLLG